MLETYYKMLNPTETIQNAMPAITEAFVMFYGEENREFIEQKFKDMLIIGYSSPSTVKSILISMKEKKSNELIEKLFSESGIDPKSKEAMEYIGSSYLESTGYSLISYYSKLLKGEEIPPYNKRELINFLKSFCPELTEENFLEFQSSGTFRNMENLARKYDSIMEEYEEFLETIKDSQTYVENSEHTLKTLEEKYYLEFMEEFKEFLPPEDFEKMKNANGFVKSTVANTSYLSTLIGWSFNSNALIDSFDEENEKKLASSEEWRVESVKKNRIEYFQKRGIDHGKNYEEYRNDKECQKLIPSLEFIQTVKKKRQEFYTKLMNEYYLSTEDYKRNRKRITDAGCIVSNDYFNANSYENNTTFITDNLVVKNGEYHLFPLLCINMGTTIENLDGNVIHELNHIIELHLKEIKGNNYKITCGWDTIACEIEESKEENVSLKDREEKRGYELFNEIVNELIAQEITTILFDSGNYIFNPIGTGKIKGRTGYDSTGYLVADFFQQNHEEIIASRRNGNIPKVKEAVGEDNFEKLNELFHLHNDHFQGFEIYNLYDDLDAKRDTSRTQTFRSLLQKRDEVLKSIEEYKNQKESKRIA